LLRIDDALNSSPPARWGLSEDQKRRIKAFTYLNENELARPRYEYIDNIHDGRGYTGGVIGFTMQSGSMLQIVEGYSAKRPDNELAGYIPRLRELNQTVIHEVTGMPGFVEAWQRAANDPLMQRTQDEAVDKTFNPAMLTAEVLGLNTALGKLCIYDAMVQHGLGDDDPDGLVAIIRRTQARMQGDPAHGTDEKQWLKVFLEERRKILACAHDPETRQTWAPSVERVDFLKRIYDSGNFTLHGPIDAGDFFDDVEIP
jgi:chitosanase